MVTDFGIARAAEGGDSRLTATGMALGTPAYMSPEQASGEREVDGRSDVYSLGCVLFEMLAGARPFVGRKQEIISRRMVESPPAVRQHRPTVSPQLDEVIRRAMSLSPADRYQTGKE